MKLHINNHHESEKGFASIILMGFAAIAFAAGTAMWLTQKQEDSALVRVHAQAKYIAHVNNAVRAYIVANSTAVLARTAISTALMGVDWLKAGVGGSKCTGVVNANTVSYIPCFFKNIDVYDNTPTTILGSEKLITGAGSLSVPTSRTIFDPIVINGKMRMDIAEKVIDFAEGTNAPTSNAASINSFTNLSLETNNTIGQRGRIYASSTLTDPSVDIYLRVDGNNTMKADLNMNDGVNHNIVGAANGTFSGGLTAATGTFSGNVTSSGIITGSDVKTMGGRTLRTSAINQNIVAMSRVTVGTEVMSASAAINVSLYTCDTGLSLKIFAIPVSQGNDAISNGWITYAEPTPIAPSAPTSFKIITRMHTSVWEGSKAGFPAFAIYTLRCQ